MKYFDTWVSPSESFWEEHPQFMADPVFKPFYTKDRSRDHHKTSKAMWYIILSEDLDSSYYKLPSAERHSVICEVVELDPYETFGDETMDSLRDRFRKLTDSTIAKTVRLYEKKLEERNKFIEETPYTVDSTDYNEETGKTVTIKGTATQLDRMILDSRKLTDFIQQLRDSLSNEGEDAQGINGAEPSFLESGMQ